MALFFRRKNQNEFIISNSKTSFIINIRTGEKKNFPAIIPLNSTIYEPFLGYWDDENWAYLVDAQTKGDFIKIYYLKDNVYHKYHAVNINKQNKRKYERYTHNWYKNQNNRFIIGIQDNDNNFELRDIDTLGNEIFKSQKINIANSTDFIIYTTCYPQTTQIYAYIFYENKIVLHQWSRQEGNTVFYTTDNKIINNNLKLNNLQLKEPHYPIICGQDKTDIYCHYILANYGGGMHVNSIYYAKVLEGCKSTFKLNLFNGEKYVVTCLNNNNEFVMQLFTYSFKIDYDLSGLVLWKDDINDDFTYDVLQGKENELVIIRANLKKNEYFLEIINFIKNSGNLYQPCPEGCQTCNFVKHIGIQYPNRTYLYDTTLNCTLCNFDRFFAEDFGDICFSNIKKPKGYELSKKDKKFFSCDYCCVTKTNNVNCNFCLNEKKYIYYIDEPNNGRCAPKCEGEYKYIKYDENICTNTCEGKTKCESFNNYMKINGETDNLDCSSNDEMNSNNNSSKWCLKEC